MLGDLHAWWSHAPKPLRVMAVLMSALVFAALLLDWL